MKLYHFSILLVLWILGGCQEHEKPKQDMQPITIKTENNSGQVADGDHQLDDILKTVPHDIKPTFGYRFIISGDFDGDGKKEKLVEHYVSSIDHQETNKYYDQLPEYDQLVALTIKKKPYSFLVSDQLNIDTLAISKADQQFGLAYLKNEGDLNGDGTDEVSYVVNWADWSSTNTWHLMTYKNKKWEELYWFPIWDWQLPDLPGTFNDYGLFGLMDKVVDSKNDTLNQQLEKNLSAFKGLVKKIRTNEIQIIYRNENAEQDTMKVDLKKKIK